MVGKESTLLLGCVGRFFKRILSQDVFSSFAVGVGRRCASLDTMEPDFGWPKRGFLRVDSRTGLTVKGWQSLSSLTRHIRCLREATRQFKVRLSGDRSGHYPKQTGRLNPWPSRGKLPRAPCDVAASLESPVANKRQWDSRRR
jgi:hypothetical protein